MRLSDNNAPTKYLTKKYLDLWKMKGDKKLHGLKQS